MSARLVVTVANVAKRSGGRAALSLCRGSTVSLKDGRRARVETWEQQARRLERDNAETQASIDREVWLSIANNARDADHAKLMCDHVASFIDKTAHDIVLEDVFTDSGIDGIVALDRLITTGTVFRLGGPVHWSYRLVENEIHRRLRDLSVNGWVVSLFGLQVLEIVGPKSANRDTTNGWLTLADIYDNCGGLAARAKLDVMIERGDVERVSCVNETIYRLVTKRSHGV